MNKKEVSIVIPMYNAEGTIRMALDSIRRQTVYSAILEVIVINDGSTDKSEIIVNEYQKDYVDFPLKYYSQKNSGVSASRNRGMREARGYYIAFLDSDDIWYENKLEVQLDILRNNRDIVFLGAGYQDKPFRRKGKTINELYCADLHDVLWSYFPVTPSVIFKREALNVVGFFDEKQRYCEDINFYLRFLISFNYFYIPQKLVEIDCGKEFHGEKGLTSNLSGMHQGELKNLRELWCQKHISKKEYCFYFIYLKLKYFRRLFFHLANIQKKSKVGRK